MAPLGTIVSSCSNATLAFSSVIGYCSSGRDNVSSSVVSFNVSDPGESPWGAMGSVGRIATFLIGAVSCSGAQRTVTWVRADV